MPLTGRTICTEAAQELGVIAAGDTLQQPMASMFLSQLARLVDDWNANRAMIFATDFLTFTFTPGLNPHTIGPTGTWVVDERPVQIEAAVVVLSSGVTGVNAPQIRIHDQNVGIPTWFSSLTTPNIQTSYPTDAYYNATWPNGSFYLWPVPATAYDCQIQVRMPLGSFTLDTVFSMPQGYRSAMTLTLAENASSLFPNTLTAKLERRAVDARNAIAANNTGGGALSTQDPGMPSQRPRKRSNWHFLSGLLR